MHPALQRLFERHVASSFDKQMYLAELIGESAWSFDPIRGTITFGPQATWKVQVLGSVSARTDTEHSGSRSRDTVNSKAFVPLSPSISETLAILNRACGGGSSTWAIELQPAQFRFRVTIPPTSGTAPPGLGPVAPLSAHEW